MGYAYNFLISIHGVSCLPRDFQNYFFVHDKMFFFLMSIILVYHDQDLAKICPTMQVINRTKCSHVFQYHQYVYGIPVTMVTTDMLRGRTDPNTASLG